MFHTKFAFRYSLGCHKIHELELRKFARENSSKADAENPVIICGEPQLHCLHPGCTHYANPICAANYCSEHHIEICHSLRSTVELECKKGRSGVAGDT